jgi:hypothetical protein
MKKIAWVLLALFLYTTAAAQPRTISSLTGTWLAVDADNASGGIQVIDSAKMFLIYGDQKKPITSYKLDFSKSPAWFDFTVQDGQQNIQLKSLIQFINDDLLQWQVFEGTTRPVHFANEAGDVLYLRRKK